MKEQRFQTFDQFWPHYVRAHEKKATRTLHFVGVTAAMACLAGSLMLRRPLLLALAPAASYGPAWVGHFFIEKNRPAPLQHPVWSLRADLLMWSMMLAGTMEEEVSRVVSSNGYHQAPARVEDVSRAEAAEEQRIQRARQSLN